MDPFSSNSIPQPAECWLQALRTSFPQGHNSTSAAHRGREKKKTPRKREKKIKTTPRKTFQKCCTKSDHSAERGFLCSESWPGTEQEITASCLQRKRLSHARDQKQTALQLNKQRPENFNSSSLGRLQPQGNASKNKRLVTLKRPFLPFPSLRAGSRRDRAPLGRDATSGMWKRLLLSGLGKEHVRPPIHPSVHPSIQLGVPHAKPQISSTAHSPHAQCSGLFQSQAAWKNCPPSVEVSTESKK